MEVEVQGVSKKTGANPARRVLPLKKILFSGTDQHQAIRAFQAPNV